jgi:hypothetical protein
MWYYVLCRINGNWQAQQAIFSTGGAAGALAAVLGTWQEGKNAPQKTTPQGTPAGVDFFEWCEVEYLVLKHS